MIINSKELQRGSVHNTSKLLEWRTFVLRIYPKIKHFCVDFDVHKSTMNKSGITCRVQGDLPVVPIGILAAGF